MHSGLLSDSHAGSTRLMKGSQRLPDEENLARNAAALSTELDWFVRVLDARLKLQFSQDSPCRDGPIDTPASSRAVRSASPSSGSSVRRPG